jgi:hypothetical protein
LYNTSWYFKNDTVLSICSFRFFLLMESFGQVRATEDVV